MLVALELSVLLVATTPQGPVTQDILFQSGAFTVAGTLRRPGGNTKVPAVVLIHGSGRTDRQSLRAYADALVRLGLAALTYDKRGVGKSQGPELAWRDFNFNDLAADAEAALRYLRTRSDIDTTRLGLFGVSQGGWVAPLAAERAGPLRFLILISASVSTVAEDNLFERDARLRTEGFNEEAIREVHAMHLLDLEVCRSGTRFEEFRRLWDASKDRPWFRRVYLGEQPSPPDSPYRRWYRTVMDFNPIPILERLDVPTLWIFGDPALDRLGPVSLSLERLQRLRASGKPYTINSFSGTDHSLQLARGGEVPLQNVVAGWLPGVLR